MADATVAPRLAGIRLHPIKSLDPVSVTEARISPSGGLELDRVWVLHWADEPSADFLANIRAQDVSAQVRILNGKRSAAVHRIRAAFSPFFDAVTLSAPGDLHEIPARQFAFPHDTEGAAEWFSIYFKQRVAVAYIREGLPDDTLANGPTIISTATLQRVCEWFPGVTVDEARRRFRTTLELDGVPAFWEDHLFGEKESASGVRFQIGQVNFEGSNPCARCPVPTRDSHTGEELATFQKRFYDFRREQLPAWSAASRFDHFYRLATNTFVSIAETGKVLRVGDELACSPGAGQASSWVRDAR